MLSNSSLKVPSNIRACNTGLQFQQARAGSSQAEAGAFRPSQSWHITIDKSQLLQQLPDSSESVANKEAIPIPLLDTLSTTAVLPVTVASQAVTVPRSVLLSPEEDVLNAGHSEESIGVTTAPGK